MLQEENEVYNPYTSPYQQVPYESVSVLEIELALTLPQSRIHRRCP